MADGSKHAQKLATATHLYVRFRRAGGRVLDVAWMVRNPEYAREVLRLARNFPDDDIAQMADQFEEAMFGIPAPPPRRASPVAQPQTQTGNDSSSTSTNRYRGSLR